MLESKWTNRCLRILTALVAVLLVVALFLHGRAYAKLRKVKQLQAAMANSPPEQRRAQGQQLRDAFGQLSVNQRRELSDERRKQFEANMINYTKLSSPEKQQQLDRMIDGMERM